jgi:hypothetical protein
MTTITTQSFAPSVPAPKPPRSLPTIKLPTLPKFDVRPATLIREALTIGALAGLMWFQWEILRCAW